MDGAAALPLLSIRGAFISYTVLIKTLRLPPLAGVSGVEGVWSLHVVSRQPGRGNILNATSKSSFMSVLRDNLSM